MPLRFVIEPDLDLVVTTAEGEVSDKDLLDHAARLAEIPGRPLREIVDFSDRVGTDVSLESVRNVAEFLREHDENKAGGRLALVGADDELFGLLRVFEAHRSHHSLQLRVFRTRGDALEWLGIDPSKYAHP